MSEEVWAARWAQERERRVQLLDELPGKGHHERLETLNRASGIFSSNLVELGNHLSSFVNTGRNVHDLPDGYELEAVRLFHNYLSSVATLRDMQRVTHRSVWPAKLPIERRIDERDSRTIWEVEFYRPAVEELFGDDDINFLFDLRNCSLHRTVPIMSVGTTWSEGPSGGVTQFNTVTLKRSELDKYKKWTGASKRYLGTQNSDVEFLALIEKHSQRARRFYQWFWDKVVDAVRCDVDEYLGKGKELSLWLAEEMVVPDFEEHYGGMPVPGSLRRKRAEARLKRAEYGTGGWRNITVDVAGNVVVGESDWGPLPTVLHY